MVEGCLILQNELKSDDRGIFSEIYKENIPNFSIAQLNYSFSYAGTLRGLHKTPYGKLVTCVKGKVFDVCLDLRPDSNSYKNYTYTDLDQDSLNQIYIPPNCGHGFYAYEDSILIYAQSELYDPNKDECFCYLGYNIKWPAVPKFISNRDKGSCNDIS